MAKCRQNYHEECEALINKQINVEQSAYLQYLALVRNAAYRNVILRSILNLLSNISRSIRSTLILTAMMLP